MSSWPAADVHNLELHIDVTDTGIGIPEDKLAEVFEKFTQADGSITRRYGGTGLGLTIAEKLVEIHGGKIWVESEVGRGSTFHVAIEFPRAPTASAEEAPGECETRPSRILVVEDNPVNQRVVAGLLAKRGYRISVANHGREALTALERSSFALVLMDVQMPVLDGLETTRLMRQDARWQTLPVIALTAYAMAGDRQRCLDAGMNDYLPKPVRPAELLETVGKHLTLHTR